MPYDCWTEAPSNKGMKQTSVEHIGRSQLIPGVGRTFVESRVRDRRDMGDSLKAGASLEQPPSVLEAW